MILMGFLSHALFLQAEEHRAPCLHHALQSQGRLCSENHRRPAQTQRHANSTSQLL